MLSCEGGGTKSQRQENGSWRMLLRGDIFIVDNAKLQNFIMWQPFNTPVKNRNIRLERTKKFVRKPAQEQLQRSLSRKSNDSISLRQTYIKSPSAKKQSNPTNYFQSFASGVISSTARNYRINPESSSCTLASDSKIGGDLSKKIGMLESEIELKSHQLQVVSGELQRNKMQLQKEKSKRQKVEQQRKELSKQLKQTAKSLEEAKMSMKKAQKELEYLTKQVQFLEQINFDDNTREIQSYREKFLNDELQALKAQLNKSKQVRESDLQAQIKTIQEEKYTIESHYKAMKIANQCLIKQLNHNNNNIHEIILNSEEYIKLREKYIRFLDEYKNLRNEYWTVKAQLISTKNDQEGSSLFNITGSDADGSLNQKSVDVSGSFLY